VLILNHEPHSGSRELAPANADLADLLAGTGIPTILLDRELRIRSFTPAAENVLDLASSDIGRSIGQLQERLADAGTFAGAEEVNRTGERRVAEVRGRDGTRYRRVMASYRAGDGANAGVCITFEIVKHTMDEVDVVRYAERIVHGVGTPVIVADRELRIVLTNPAMMDLSGLNKGTIVGQSINDLASRGIWLFRELRDLAAGVVSARAPVTNRPLRDDNLDLIANIDLMARSDGPEQVLVALEDVTVRREVERASIARVREQHAESLRRDQWIAMLGHELRNPLGAINPG
jgi:two-component system CheB/CheR fusion protein